MTDVLTGLWAILLSLGHAASTSFKKWLTCLQDSGQSCSASAIRLRLDEKKWLTCLQDSGQSCSASAMRPRLEALRCVLLALLDISANNNTDNTQTKQTAKGVRSGEDPVLSQVFPALIAEALLSLSEANRRTRERGFLVLVGVGERLAQLDVTSKPDLQLSPQSVTTSSASASSVSYALLHQYFRLLVAGLALESMRAPTIHALGRLLYEFKNELEQDLLFRLVRTQLSLFETTDDKQTRKALLGFSKVAALVLTEDELRTVASAMVPAILLVHKQPALRKKVQSVLTILIERLRYSTIEAAAPTYSELFNYLRKQLERNNRKKREAWLERQRSKGKMVGEETSGNAALSLSFAGNEDSKASFARLVKAVAHESGDEEDSEDEMKDNRLQEEIERLEKKKAKKAGSVAGSVAGSSTGRALKGIQNKQQKLLATAKQQKSLLLREGTEAIDFLDDNVRSRVLTLAEAKREASVAARLAKEKERTELAPNSREAKEAAKQLAKKGSVTVDNAGKIVMQLPGQVSKKRTANPLAEDDEEEDEEDEEEEQAGGAAGKRRAYGSKGGEGGGGRGAFEQAAARKRQKVSHTAGISTGKQFASKKAKGDTMRGGGIQPFAYVPMDPAHLNKRSGKHRANKIACIEISIMHKIQPFACKAMDPAYINQRSGKHRANKVYETVVGQEGKRGGLPSQPGTGKKTNKATRAKRKAQKKHRDMQ
eukprot:g50426.t1